jgi:hypothetical protein
VAVAVEVVGHGSVDGGELLQTSHASKAEHRPLASSEWKMRVLPAVIPPASSVDLHEHLVKVPSPVAGRHALDAAFPELGCEQRAEAVPPEPHRLVADLDAALVQQILDAPQLEQEPDVHHHRRVEDLGACLEVLEGAGLGHGRMVLRPLPRLKPSSSDRNQLGQLLCPPRCYPLQF